MTGKVVKPGREGPVTISISRRAKPGREADYEAWLHEVIAIASRFPGHMGANILRPSTGTGGRYILIYRFDSWVNGDAWERSAERASCIARLGGMVEDDTQTRKVTGLEAWFDLPDVPASQTAPRWKMSIVLVVIVFALVYPLQLTILPLTQDWPHWIRTLLIAAIQVALMTYVVMPRIVAMLKSWLYAG